MKFFAVFLVMIGFAMMLNSVNAYQVQDLDYANSPYDHKKTPSLGKPVDLFFQIGNYESTPQKSHVTVTIDNVDEKKQVYSKVYDQTIQPYDTIDIRWNFTPQSTGLYLVELEENNEHSKYFFAVPPNDNLKRLPITNPELLENTSPRKQFRMGIDPKLIICKDELFLALKNSNLPVCLTMNSLVELRQKNVIQAEVIDYERIGLVLSEKKFIDLLEEKNLKYKKENLTLITGMSATSLPPITGYCGYVLDDNGKDFWFSSSYHFPDFDNQELKDENPHPCKPNLFSCECSIQTILAEKNSKDLSFYDEIQQMQVGNIFKDYLNEGGKISNVPNSFTIGKYNLSIDPNVTSFCGQFQGKGFWYFRGEIQSSKIINFSLELDERPPLCAITENPIIFTFDQSAIARG